MKIFQPTISGSFTVSGSVFLKGLTSVAQSNVILVNTTTGQLYYTASSAIGGGGGGGTVDTSSLVTTASFNAYTGSNISQFAGTASYVTLAARAEGRSNLPRARRLGGLWHLGFQQRLYQDGGHRNPRRRLVPFKRLAKVPRHVPLQAALPSDPYRLGYG